MIVRSFNEWSKLCLENGWYIKLAVSASEHNKDIIRAAHCIVDGNEVALYEWFRDGSVYGWISNEQ